MADGLGVLAAGAVYGKGLVAGGTCEDRKVRFSQGFAAGFEAVVDDAGVGSLTVYGDREGVNTNGQTFYADKGGATDFGLEGGPFAGGAAGNLFGQKGKADIDVA